MARAEAHNQPSRMDDSLVRVATQRTSPAAVAWIAGDCSRQSRHSRQRQSRGRCKRCESPSRRRRRRCHPCFPRCCCRMTRAQTNTTSPPSPPAQPPLDTMLFGASSVGANKLASATCHQVRHLFDVPPPAAEHASLHKCGRNSIGCRLVTATSGGQPVRLQPAGQSAPTAPVTCDSWTASTNRLRERLILKSLRKPHLALTAASRFGSDLAASGWHFLWASCSRVNCASSSSPEL